MSHDLLARLRDALRENAALLAMLTWITERLRADPRYQDIVRHVDAWYDGRETNHAKRRGNGSTDS